ncbi:MAG: sodium:proton antiporter, partial [Alphaproteobacteria bacterium]|nr:sodium:proton antiporter [Alphaproteobacteria bacterium]
VVDTVMHRREGPAVAAAEAATEESLGFDGKINFLLLAGIVASVLMSGIWKPGFGIDVYHVHWELQGIVRDILLLAIAYLSWKLTSRANRDANGFTWFPIIEVAKLFAGIFLTIVPAIAILKAGTDGALGGVVAMVTSPDGEPVNIMYFWLTGLLSSFLDNAPTYLVFFNTAGGDPVHLMTDMATTLLAISAGAVFMGANTYIGNAPNFMVRAIAEERNVAMPSFFGYMLWSGGILIPTFVLVTFVFFV